MSRILLLSAYDAASHRHWRQWLESSLRDYQWTCLTLPDRHFYWRIRSNALSFYAKYQRELAQRYDLIIATSMTDLSTLRGFAPNLADCPAIVYFHENQFAYPVTSNPQGKGNLLNARLNTILTAFPAKTLAFNSEYNRRTFFQGVELFFKKMPDGLDRGLIEKYLSKAIILPVPIYSARVCEEKAADEKNEKVPEIVWNHRWEYDKQPEVFFSALYVLQQAGVPFKLHVLGQSFRKIPQCFVEAKQRLTSEISTWGYQSRDNYLHVLESADIVVSTAVHDFQGLGMLEAIHRQCVPVAPRRVAYPEYIPAELLYDPDNEVESLSDLLADILIGGLPAVPSVNRFLDIELESKYRCLIEGSIKKG